MRDAQHQQQRHGVVEVLPVGAVQLRHRREDEGEGHVLEEIAVRARREVERVWRGGGLLLFVVGGGGGGIGRGGGGRGGGFGEAVAEVFFVFEPLVGDPVGEEEEVGCVGEGPCSCYGFCVGGRVLV